MSPQAKVPHGRRAELARAVKLSLGYLNQVLAGHKRPTLEVAVRLVVAMRDLFGLDVSVEELVRPDTPWPVDVRFLACEPPLSPVTIAERQARREQAHDGGPANDAGDAHKTAA